MQRFAVCFVACSVLALLMAGAVDAQETDDQFDCADFDSQEEAQAELDSDPSDPSNLDADDDGEACEVFPYDDPGVGGGGGSEDLDCADFRSQAEAQREYERDRSDPHRLDADDDGEACEEFDYAVGAGSSDNNRGAADRQYGRDEVIVKTIPKQKKLSKTGGASLILPAGALLLGAGLLLERPVIRRAS